MDDSSAQRQRHSAHASGHGEGAPVGPVLALGAGAGAHSTSALPRGCNSCVAVLVLYSSPCSVDLGGPANGRPCRCPAFHCCCRDLLTAVFSASLMHTR